MRQRTLSNSETRWKLFGKNAKRMTTEKKKKILLIMVKKYLYKVLTLLWQIWYWVGLLYFSFEHRQFGIICTFITSPWPVQAGSSCLLLLGLRFCFHLLHHLRLFRQVRAVYSCKGAFNSWIFTQGVSGLTMTNGKWFERNGKGIKKVE